MPCRACWASPWKTVLHGSVMEIGRKSTSTHAQPKESCYCNQAAVVWDYMMACVLSLVIPAAAFLLLTQPLADAQCV